MEAELLDPVKELLDPLMVNQFFPATKEAFDMVIHKNRVSLSIWRANQEQHTTSDGDKHKFIKLTAKLTLHPAPWFRYATIEVKLLNQDFKIADVSAEETISDEESKQIENAILGFKLGPASHVPVGLNVGRSIQKEFSRRKCIFVLSKADTSTAIWTVVDPDENQQSESLIADLGISLTHPEGATTCPAKLSVDVITHQNRIPGQLSVKDHIFNFDFTGLD